MGGSRHALLPPRVASVQQYQQRRFATPTPEEQVLGRYPLEPVCLLGSGSPVTLTEKAEQGKSTLTAQLPDPGAAEPLAWMFSPTTISEGNSITHTVLHAIPGVHSRVTIYSTTTHTCVDVHSPVVYHD